VTATQTTTPVVVDSAGSEDAGEQEMVADGLAVYKDQYCGVCHQLGAAGTGGLFGPTHDGMGVTAAERIQDPGYAGGATTGAEYLRESIVDPQAYLVPGYEATSHSMPAYGYLSEQEIMALVELLAGQE
jgi:nitric oxide reductase subunit C